MRLSKAVRTEIALVLGVSIAGFETAAALIPANATLHTVVAIVVAMAGAAGIRSQVMPMEKVAPLLAVAKDFLGGPTTNAATGSAPNLTVTPSVFVPTPTVPAPSVELPTDAEEFSRSPQAAPSSGPMMPGVPPAEPQP